MTHTPLTKAEREELRKIASDFAACEMHIEDVLPGAGMLTTPAATALRALPRLLADLDAAEAERDGWKEAAKTHLAGKVDAWSQRDRAESERDALKAKLADPRRVLIHETEVVATKEEIATLKARLADLSDADEELHTCRALVNATSENLSVDLERMVDDLAEANEKAALSGKDSHSWHELYKDTKAKLAALVAINKKVLRQATVRKVPPFNNFFEVGWGEDEEKEWNKALGDLS